MWPIQLAFLLYIVRKIFLPSLVMCNSSFSHNRSIFLQLHISKLPRCIRLLSPPYKLCLLGLWFRIPPKGWMSVFCECHVLSCICLGVGLMTRPEESCRVWNVEVWSWSFGYKGALAHWGLLCNGENNIIINYSIIINCVSFATRQSMYV